MQQPRTRYAGWLPGEWPYWAGGLALAAGNTAVLALSGKPWGVTAPLTYLLSRGGEALGMEPGAWDYFQPTDRAEALMSFTWLDSHLWLTLGVIVGALLASWTTDEWSLRWPRSWKAAGLALAGGLLMGYGARLALGCTVGALLGGIPSFSLHGWLFLIFVLLGVLAGLKWMRRWL